MSSNNRRVVYAITERENQDGEVKSYFTRVGAAFDNKDGSINLLLEALPVSGKLQIRDLSDEEKPAKKPVNKGGALQCQALGQ